MTAKYLFITTIISFLTISAFAQTETTYYKNDGKRLLAPDTADYIRVIVKDSSTTSLYDVTERYKNGNLKSEGKSTRKDYIKWTGHYTLYYANGKKQEEGTYLNDKLTGDFFDYFANGLLHSVKEYIKEKQQDNSNGNTKDDYLFKTCNDSTGTSTLVNGNGHYVGYNEVRNKFYEEGYVKDGERTGMWTGKTETDVVSFTEKYEKGTLVKGISTDKNGKVYNYTTRGTQPTYTGGEAAFNSFLTNNIRYPQYSKKNNIQGRVLISFVVERDGTATDFIARRTPSQDLANEAIRVLRLTPKWQPGIKYGQPVRVQFIVPINFSLAE